MLVRNIVILLFLVTSTSLAQTFYASGGALDIPTDARSVAMGESFTAMNDPLAGLMYNPASLSAEKGISFLHTRREFFSSSSMNYFTTGLTVHSLYGNFGILYSLFDNSSHSGSYNHNHKDYILGISYSHSIGEHVSVGMSVKTYDIDESYNYTASYNDFYSNGYSLRSETTTQPILLDLGILYSSNLFRRQSSSGTYSLGLSIQNFGTELFRKYTEGNLIYHDAFVQLPKYLRTGFSVSMAFHGNEESKFTPVAITISGEYRNLLNATESRKSYRDQFGFGTEISLFDVVALRGGGFIFPYDGVFGDKGNVALRYGIGICAPFEKLGVNLPFMLNIDYGAIPLNNYDAYSPVELLSLQIHYTNDLF